MVFLRALIYSSDKPTQQQTTASVIKTYMVTQNADLKDLQEHVIRHGSPPCVHNVDSMVTIANSPGLNRLCGIENPKYYGRCLENMFQMAIKCNLRISIQGLNTAAAELDHKKTKLGNFSQKRKQTNNEHGHSCAVFMATTS